MGAFIGAFLVILTILYQSFTYDQTITKEVNLGKTDDLEIIQLINDLNNLNVIPSETQTKTVNFFQQNCNNNYSIILQCEKRYATDKEVVSNYENNILTQAEKDALWPPEQFCQAFYGYVEGIKGKNGRLLLDELKELLVQVNTFEHEDGMNPDIIVENNYPQYLNLLKTEPQYNGYLNMELSNFTNPYSTTTNVFNVVSNDPKTSAEKFVSEFKKYNFLQHTRFFEVNNPNFTSLGLIKKALNNPITIEITPKRKDLFLGSTKISYYYVGSHNDTKQAGIKVFINENLKLLLSYREILLKLKHISPEIDLILNKRYNGQISIIEPTPKYWNAFEKMYLYYKDIMEVLKINDVQLFITTNNTDITELSKEYNNNITTYYNIIEGIASNVDYMQFIFGVVSFKTPLTNGYTITKDGTIPEEYQAEIDNRRICDFSQYSKQINY